MSAKGKAIQVGDKVLIPIGVAATGGVVANQLPQNKKSTKKAIEDVNKHAIKDPTGLVQMHLKPALKSVGPAAVRATRKARGRLKSVPTAESVKKSLVSDDPYFNAKAAQEAFDLVMKMDFESAHTFCMFTVQDVLEETIEKNQRTLQRHLDEVVSKRVERIKKAIVSKAVSNPEAIPYAQALSLIEKATPYDYGYRFRESDFNRDPGSGQFRTKIKPPQSKKPLSDKQAKAFGVPPKKDLTGAAKARYQSDYMQVAQFLRAVTQSGGMATDDVLVHIQDKDGVYSTHASGPNPKDLWDPKSEKVIGIEARPASLKVGGAAFGLTTALGGSTEAGRRRAAGATAIDSGMNSFANDWIKPGEGKNSTDRLYNRVHGGASFISAYGDATGNRHLQMAGAFGQFVGSHGPEAEAVFGPPTRKMAYRYRGTEKTPDKEMVRAYEVEIKNAKMADALGYQNQRGGRAANLKNQTRLAPQQLAAQRIMAERRAPTWEERTGGRYAIMNHLMQGSDHSGSGRAPSSRLYGLHLESGNTPPSEGVMLNADGQIVAQAVGYGDDHYLPFNLRNLKDLKGGEYIRSRSVGGPTAEDIYVGLMSGARQITVVSRSGIFQVEFQEDFRGGRRHNDKARRMVGRYQQILDSVQSEQVDRAELDPTIKEAIRAEVTEKYGATSTRAELREQIREREKEFKSDPEMDEHDEELITRLMASRPTDQSAQDYKNEIITMLKKEKEYRYRLNGPGYASALEALQEQFPYYIKVRNNTEKAREELKPDKGYVAPGRNRPTKARAGYFDPMVTGLPKEKAAEGKYSAAEADYQGARNVKHHVAGGTLTPVEAATTGDGETSEKPKEGEAKNKVQALLQQGKKQTDYSAAAAVLHKKIKARALNTDDSEYKKIHAMNEAEFAAYAKTADGRKEFRRLVEELNGLDEKDKPFTEKEWDVFRIADGQFNRIPYDKANAQTWSAQPYIFTGKGFGDGASETEVNDALKLLGIKNKAFGSDKLRSEMTENELMDEHEKVVRLRGLIEALGGAVPAGKDRDLVINDLGLKSVDPDVFKSVDKVDEHLEAIHKIRALMADRPANGATPAMVITGPKAQSPAGVLKPLRVQLDQKMSDLDIYLRREAANGRANTAEYTQADEARSALILLREEIESGARITPLEAKIALEEADAVLPQHFRDERDGVHLETDGQFEGLDQAEKVLYRNKPNLFWQKYPNGRNP